jgi:hypothetical protein
VAIWAAAWLEYPTANLALDGRHWHVDLILLGMGLGVLGVVLVLGGHRTLRAVRSLGSRRRIARSRRRGSGDNHGE